MQVGREEDSVVNGLSVEGKDQSAQTREDFVVFVCLFFFSFPFPPLPSSFLFLIFSFLLFFSSFLVFKESTLKTLAECKLNK